MALLFVYRSFRIGCQRAQRGGIRTFRASFVDTGVFGSGQCFPCTSSEQLLHNPAFSAIMGISTDEKEVPSMKSLEESRAAIDAVDREIVRLFEERMKLCRDVARYKIASGLPVLDRSREEKVLESRAAMLQDAYWTDSVRALFEQVMALSRAEQEKLLKGEG